MTHLPVRLDLLIIVMMMAFGALVDIRNICGGQTPVGFVPTGPPDPRYSQGHCLSYTVCWVVESPSPTIKHRHATLKTTSDGGASWLALTAAGAGAGEPLKVLFETPAVGC